MEDAELLSPTHSIQTNSHKIQTEIYNGFISNLANARVSSPAALQMQGFRIFRENLRMQKFPWQT